MDKIRAFFNGVKKEISRVRWPNKKQLFKSSLAVVVFSLFFALFFYLTDLFSAFVRALVR
jgi:preprotein translocase subunit SecE